MEKHHSNEEMQKEPLLVDSLFKRNSIAVVFQHFIDHLFHESSALIGRDTPKTLWHSHRRYFKVIYCIFTAALIHRFPFTCDLQSFRDGCKHPLTLKYWDELETFKLVPPSPWRTWRIMQVSDIWLCGSHKELSASDRSSLWHSLFIYPPLMISPLN